MTLRTVSSLAAAFYDDMKVRRFSKQTLMSHHANLKLFTSWCEVRGIDDPAVVTRKILERYQRHVFYAKKKDGTAYAPSTQHARVVIVKSFFAWLCRQDFLSANPAADLRLPKKPRRLPRDVLTPAEVETLLLRCDVTEPIGLRDRAILELFYATGMRRAELAGLSLSDLDTERETAFIKEGKGEKDRMLPIGERAALWIEKYKDESRPALVVAPDAGILFLSQRGQGFNLAALSRLVSNHVAQSGIDKKGACHLLRHACATHMLEGGAAVRYIQAMLGHARLDTTEIYTHVAIRALKAIHAATHPGARLERTVDDDDSGS